jgi:hypothetical protein
MPNINILHYILHNYSATKIAGKRQIAKKRKSTLKVSFAVNVPYKASEIFCFMYILFFQIPYCFSFIFNCFSAFFYENRRM